MRACSVCLRECLWMRYCIRAAHGAVQCTSWGYATAVDSESEDERKPARQANIKEGTGVMLLLWQILYELITSHGKDTQKFITRVPGFVMTKFSV